MIFEKPNFAGTPEGIACLRAARQILSIFTGYVSAPHPA